MTDGTPRSAGAVAPVPVVFLGGFVLGVVVNLFIPLRIWPSVWIQVIGIVPLGVGIWLLASSREAFRRHKTPLMPWEPSVELVQDGPYRYSRNPVYLSFALMYLGASLVVNSTLLLVVLALLLFLFDRTQIPREERYLAERFGEAYALYKSKVRRWI
jgi:protein-S-isoprenylcysteine O-methyltransferase Ste14